VGYYRFAAKVRKFKPLLDSCIVAVLARLDAANPGMGESIAIDGSDLPACANGQRFVSKNGRERKLSEYSDPDASWGHRSTVPKRKGGGVLRVQGPRRGTLTGLPVAWTVETARDAETTFSLGLLDGALGRGCNVKNAIMDKGYDNGPIHDGWNQRGVCPITPLRKTPAVVRGDHHAPTCEHGAWLFKGADYKRRATKWRCPTGECQPKSTWIKANRLHPLIPHHTARSTVLYKSRGTVAREFGLCSSMNGRSCPVGCAESSAFAFALT
jgi:hypothetical protein